MIATNQQKLQNYLLGQIRKKMPDYPPKEVILIIINFLKEKQAFLDDGACFLYFTNRVLLT